MIPKPVLRDYQTEAASQCVAAIDKGTNGLVAMPTGSGKSLVISEIASRIDGNLVVLQPTKEILEQNLTKAWECGVHDIAVWSASMNRRHKNRITFATIGSIVKNHDIFSDASAVIIDEAHLVNPKSGQYDDFIKKLDKPTIGLTATPYRMHREQSAIFAKFLHHARPKIFSRLIHVTQNRDLHAKGYLCPVQYKSDPDYDPAKITLKNSGLNYEDDALAEYNRLLHVSQKTIDVILKNYGWHRHFLVFCSSIEDSQNLHRALFKAGIASAHLDGAKNKTEREKILKDFRAGRVRVVTNVNVLTTGYDFPSLDCVILARPTLSLLLYYQMVGRCVRTAPTKDQAVVYDLCGNVKRFGRPDQWWIDYVGERNRPRLMGASHYLTDWDFVELVDLYAMRQSAGKAREKAVAQKTTGTLTVTFGRHKGQPVSSVPLDYVKWCANTMDDGPWRRIFMAELQRRSA